MKTESTKITHYSREGYEGKYNYMIVCGKEIKPREDNCKCSIHPEEANCPDCLSSKTYQTDLADMSLTEFDMKRRIYIESDILHADEFRGVQSEVSDIAETNGLKCVGRVFSKVLDFAWHTLDQTWDAVKNADEIYETSSLMPLTGNSYRGAPVIFNGMCERAVKENVTGKSVYILNNLKRIHWDMIDKDLMKEAFKENDLYMYDDNYELIKINVSEL